MKRPDEEIRRALREVDSPDELVPVSIDTGTGEVAPIAQERKISAQTPTDHCREASVRIEDSTGTLSAIQLPEGEINQIDTGIGNWSLTAMYDGTDVHVRFREESGMEAVTDFQIQLGGLPEFNPPAEAGGSEGDSISPEPRPLDRDIGADEVGKVLDFICANWNGYAITFPESEAPEAYIRGAFGSWRRTDAEFRFPRQSGPDWGLDEEFAVIRRDGIGGRFERQGYTEEQVLRRVLRASATRIVSRQTAPDELYAED